MHRIEETRQHSSILAPHGRNHSHGSKAQEVGVETTVHNKFRLISFLFWVSFEINRGHVLS